MRRSPRSARVAGKGSQARRAELLGGSVRRGDRDRADLPAPPARRRTAAGRAGRGHGRRRRQGGRRPAAAVRRAAMLGGDLPAVAAAALTGGAPALDEFTLRVGRPVGPMLAQTATGVDDALERLGGASGFRGQARRRAGADPPPRRRGHGLHPKPRRCHRPAARSRRGDAALPVTELIADGEAIALRPDGRPHRFQVTASRFGRSVDIAAAASGATTFGVLLRLPARRRCRPARRADHRAVAALDASCRPAPGRPAGHLRSVPGPALPGPHAGRRPRGRDGQVADAPYEAGRRGAGWLKVKPVHTLDLVVLAVEWGSGRRTGKLSNIHLGARDPVSGEFVMLGKTFKGMTDAMLDWQTARFTELAVGGRRRLRRSRCAPSRSSRSRSTACRAPRATPAAWRCASPGCVRYRDDKGPAEADTIDTVRAFYERGGP